MTLTIYGRRCERAPLVLHILFLIGALTATAQAQQASEPVPPARTWTGNFTGSGEAEKLIQRGGDLYLSRDASLAPILAGSVNGYNTGELGIYAGNLDGNAREQYSLAYFDPDLGTWFWGAFNGDFVTWTRTGEIVNGKSMFHVGDGPTFFPVDQLDKTVSSGTAASAGLSSFAALRPAAQANAAAVPFTYPVEGSQYTALAPSQHMWTNFVCYGDGNVFATTRVKEDTLLAGFHGSSGVAFFSPYDLQNPLWKVDTRKNFGNNGIGVTGTLFGHSDVTSSWQGQIPPELLPRLQYYAVVQQSAPNWLTTFNNVNQFVQAITGIVKPLESLIPGLPH